MPKKKVKQRKNAYARIRSLGRERVAVIEQMLIKGHSAGDVATVIQEEWGEHKDVKHGTLMRQIDRYRKQELGNTLAVQANTVDEEERRVVLARVNEQMDVLDEMQELAYVQKARLKKALQVEEKMPTLQKFISNEVKTFRECLAEIAKLQLETGLLQRAARDVHAKLDIYDFRTEYAEMRRELNDRDEEARATLEVMEELGLLEGPDDADG